MPSSRALVIAFVSSAACGQAVAQKSPPSSPELHLGVTKWQILERESGPVDYYAVIADPVMP